MMLVSWLFHELANNLIRVECGLDDLDDLGHYLWLLICEYMVQLVGVINLCHESIVQANFEITFLPTTLLMLFVLIILWYTNWPATLLR